MAGIFPRKRALVAMLMLTTLPMAVTAAGITIPEWVAPPAACLPSRVGTQSQCNGDTCYCPPPSLCPSPNTGSWAQFLSDSQMPPALTLACCTLPVCPGGSKFAGQVLPADENCSPPDVCYSYEVIDPVVPEPGLSAPPPPVVGEVPQAPPPPVVVEVPQAPPPPVVGEVPQAPPPPVVEAPPPAEPSPPQECGADAGSNCGSGNSNDQRDGGRGSGDTGDGPSGNDG
jgi:hypothetical protein